MRALRRALSTIAIALLAALPARAQLGMGEIPEAKTLVQVSPAPARISAGGVTEAAVTLTVLPGWHINANPASPDYMIPTQVELAGGSGVTAGTPLYPAPRPLKVEFEENPLFVFDGTAVIRVPLRAAADARNGTHALKGKLTFQSCNDQVCLAPVTVPFEVAVTVSGGSSTGPAPAAEAAPGDTTRAPPDTAAAGAAAGGAGFTTAPPAGGATGAATAANPLARALERGGVAAFMTLFLVGLALNLTPCVYPMIGVTVSIFGARRAAPPLQVFGYAVVYVLGMAVMYSALGLIAAFTGGLFGGLLQNPMVLVVIGALLIVLAFGMFGLYQLQLPPALLSRLGGSGTTSLAGVFLSGLMVGVFAAPCVGPPVVALLAVVGAKGDPWFGFWSFFVLALGLGAPYLVLGTFTNLIKSLPRSGDWLLWMEHAFGVILLCIGAFYLSLGIAPKWAVWIPPAGLLLGGLYLGFLERSADRRRGFRWIKRGAGAAAAVAGIALVVTAPTESISFEPFTPAALESALQGGQPAMLDFTANWCAPCHELERLTFTDRRVRDAARGFRAFRVDLTHYDSPESESWRRRFEIRGVPTVLFLAPDGTEVRAARVEGFIAADGFLERMRLARGEAPRAAR